MARILSLDDEPETLDLLGLILEHVGYEHLKTTDSHEALAILRRQPVDLMTQDLLRPDIDGKEFYRQMKADEALRAIPIVIISANLPTAENLAEKPEIDGYISKPFEPVTLIMIISEALSQRGIPQPPILDALQALSPTVRRAAVRVLLQGARPMPEDPKGQLLLTALDPLKGVPDIPDKKAVATLIKALSHTNPWTRWIAASALTYSRAEKAVEPLIQALHDSDDNVRRSAAYALGELGDTRAVEPLVKALQDIRTTVITSAVQALGQLGDARAIPALKQLIEERTRRPGHGLVVAEIAQRAIEAIEHTQGERSK